MSALVSVNLQGASAVMPAALLTQLSSVNTQQLYSCMITHRLHLMQVHRQANLAEVCCHTNRLPSKARHATEIFGGAEIKLQGLMLLKPGITHNSKADIRLAYCTLAAKDASG